MQVYLNGQWVESENAVISVEDRGFLYGDSIYEVVRYYHGRPLAMAEHLERLRHSAEAIAVELTDDALQLDRISDELMQRNGLEDAIAYWQVTRGVAPRKHAFPDAPVRPTVLVMAYPARTLHLDTPITAMRAIIQPDIRWHDCYIKTISLLPNVLAAQAAADQQCAEAILVRDGIVTEGTQRSIFIVHEDKLWTYPLDGRILDSITRRIVIHQAHELGFVVREEPFSVELLDVAEEVLAVGSSTEVASIVQVDDHIVGNGQPGPIAMQLFEAYKQLIATTCGGL